MDENRVIYVTRKFTTYKVNVDERMVRVVISGEIARCGDENEPYCTYSVTMSIPSIRDARMIEYVSGVIDEDGAKVVMNDGFNRARKLIEALGGVEEDGKDI